MISVESSKQEWSLRTPLVPPKTEKEKTTDCNSKEGMPSQILLVIREPINKGRNISRFVESFYKTSRYTMKSGKPLNLVQRFVWNRISLTNRFLLNSIALVYDYLEKRDNFRTFK